VRDVRRQAALRSDGGADPVAAQPHLSRSREGHDVRPGLRQRSAEILGSFKPYYREASLEEETDPDIVHDLQAKLDTAAIYTEAEVEAFIEAYLDKRHGAMTAPLKAGADRFNSRYAAAIARCSQSRANLKLLKIYWSSRRLLLRSLGNRDRFARSVSA
jgi:hypothetical protein